MQDTNIFMAKDLHSMAAATAFDLWRAREQDTLTVRCGCDAIDELLDGGFRSGILTEICGEASAGKTQLCLQLLLQSTLPKQFGGLESTACYICTEGMGSIKRLHELAGVYVDRYGSSMVRRKRRRAESSDAASESASKTSNAFLDGIFIEQVYEADDLLDLLQSRLPTLLEEQNTKLVVIDSIAAVFRLEATTSIKEASRRSRLMFHMANCMRILSTQYKVVFVMSNQVTGNFNSDAAQQPFGIGTGNVAHKPALGLSWSNCINQRKDTLVHSRLVPFLSVMESRLMITRKPNSSLRRIEVAFSPHLPNASASFAISSEGVTTVDD